MTRVKFIGAYKVEVSQREFDVALSFAGAAAFVENELSSLALIELEVVDVGDFDLLWVKQPNTESVPYDETYYDPLTLAPIHCFRPTLEHFRVAFFLHFYDPGQPLNTPWENLQCEKVRPLPDHLIGKKYLYWR